MVRQLRCESVVVELTAEAEHDVRELTSAEKRNLEKTILDAVKVGINSVPQRRATDEIYTSALVDGLTIFMVLSRLRARISGIQSTILHSSLPKFHHAIAIPFFVRNVPVSLTKAACEDIRDYSAGKMLALKESLPLAVRRVLDWLPTRSDDHGYLVRTVAYGFSYFMFASWSHTRIMEIRTSTSPDSISGPVRAQFDSTKTFISISMPRSRTLSVALLQSGPSAETLARLGVMVRSSMPRFQATVRADSSGSSARSELLPYRFSDVPQRHRLDLVA